MSKKMIIGWGLVIFLVAGWWGWNKLDKTEEVGNETVGAVNEITGTWMWEKTVVGDESVVTPKKEGVFSLQFDTEGMVYGKTDCNSFRGTYETTEEKTITFGPLASTMMYCEGSQENIFTGEVSQTDHYVFDESGNLVLNLNLDSGSMYFKRK